MMDAETKRRFLPEWLSTAIYAVLIALVVRTFAFQPFNIPSESMLPTLLVGDYLFVSKYSYGYSRYSFPDPCWLLRQVGIRTSCFDGGDGGRTAGVTSTARAAAVGAEPASRRVFADPPERGDVAVFKLPRDPSVDYIKRIIGLPGDRIQMRNGVLYINGEPVKRERVADYLYRDNPGNIYRIPRYRETLPNGVSFETLDLDPRGPHDNTRVYNVPPGFYFVMGDNRDNSLDSRVESGVGLVPEANLVGRAEVLFFSTDGSAAIWEFWKWPAATRFSRLFEAIG